MEGGNWMQILTDSTIPMEECSIKFKLKVAASNLMMFGVSTEEKFKEKKLYNCYGHYYAGNGYVYSDANNEYWGALCNQGDTLKVVCN